LKMKLIWSDAYEVELFGHVFPVEKYRLTKEAVLKAGVATEGDFIAAPRARLEDILLVHTRGYVDDLMNLRWSHRTMRSELALTQEIVDAYLICAGGTIEASNHALTDGVCMHLGGGYHHAYPDHAEGFCYLNDVSVAIARAKRDGLVARACVIDCDLHQGNGTAYIFAQDADVFTFSIHQENNYPFYKPKSDMDIGLPDRTRDKEYIAHLEKHIPKIISDFKPEFIMYVAGADPYEHDQIGNRQLHLSPHDLSFSCAR